MSSHNRPAESPDTFGDHGIPSVVAGFRQASPAFQRWLHKNNGRPRSDLIFRGLSLTGAYTTQHNPPNQCYPARLQIGYDNTGLPPGEAAHVRWIDREHHTRARAVLFQAGVVSLCRFAFHCACSARIALYVICRRQAFDKADRPAGLCDHDEMAGAFHPKYIARCRLSLTHRSH